MLFQFPFYSSLGIDHVNHFPILYFIVMIIIACPSALVVKYLETLPFLHTADFIGQDNGCIHSFLFIFFFFFFLHHVLKNIIILQSA